MESLLGIDKVQDLMPSATKGKQAETRSHTLPVVSEPHSGENVSVCKVQCELKRSVCYCYIDSKVTLGTNSYFPKERINS